MKNTWVIKDARDVQTLVCAAYFLNYIASDKHFINLSSALAGFIKTFRFLSVTLVDGSKSSKPSFNLANALLPSARASRITSKLTFARSKGLALKSPTSSRPYRVGREPVFAVLLNVFFLFNYAAFSRRISGNASSGLLHVSHQLHDLLVIDVKAVSLRWTDAYNFLFNIFFYRLSSLVLGSPFFKNETLAFNWSLNTLKAGSWRYFNPFFIFKLNRYNRKTSSFVRKLKLSGTEFFIAADSLYHYKNLYYVRKSGCYSIGLVDVSLDPWVVDYPIFGFFESIVTQAFFFKLIASLRRQACARQYLLTRSAYSNIVSAEVRR